MAQNVKLANSTTNPEYTTQMAIPVAAGGLSAKQIIAGATTNATLVKASAGQVYKVTAFNEDATDIAYVKLYNVATAPALTTDTPVVTIAVPARGQTTAGYRELNLDYGVAFSTGIGASITLSAGATGATVIATAKDVVVNIFYK